jgi:DUF4097 and DUF4098 domain-containing protein YvlB
MKRPLLCIAFAALVSAPSLARADYSFHEAFTATHPMTATGEVTIANANGAVTIRTWDRAEVKIEGEKRAQTDEELKQVGISIEPSSAALVLKTNFPRRTSGWFGGDTIRAEVRLTVTVPATARLRAIDAVNGSVHIEGVRGAVTVHNVNGGVTATGLAADAALETVNGSIRAEFASIAADQKISARTVNGSATISLPRNASLALRARSVNGSISCDFPIRLDGGKSRRSLEGTIGDGGASLHSETVNGSIHVRQL